MALAACGGSDRPKKSLEDLAVKDYNPQFPPDLPFNPDDGWENGGDYPLIGDPRAKRVKGREFVLRWMRYPTTLRTDGPNSGAVQTLILFNLMYESMLAFHPETERYIPILATHWKVVDNDDDTHTFTFHLNPKARFADGNEVTADDIYWNWWHRVQEDRKDPSNVLTFAEGYEEPEILDKHTIRVKTKKRSWRLLLYFGGMAIYPARYLKIPGDMYIKEYNWRFMPGSGPYYMKPEDLKKGESLTLTRRDNWWAENERWAKHTYNFDRLKFVVIRDQELWYEKFKKGEMDWYIVGRAQRWVEEIPEEEIINKGWVQRRKIYNQAPEGYAGLCFNMRKPPFNDKRVRMAFCHLFNREQLMEKLFFHEYEYMNSLFPGRDWGSGDERPRVEYDPVRARELLAQAGYEERNENGYLVGPDGKQLEVTLEYWRPPFERIWLVVKESYEKAGIKFNLKLIDGATLQKKIDERNFRIHYQPWNALTFPNPETAWKSSLADQQNNNNIVGFKNERVDELLKEYNVVFDRAKQKEITREIDTIICNEYPYALGWYANFTRLLYWDKFGHPDTYFTRTGQQPDEQMMLLWWFDEDKERQLAKARDADQPLPQGPKIVKPWASGGDK
jgi:microcin C transport system substrate-binding protein